ncbi:MAG: hypothetical protein R3325_11300 [Thermoanaerobaculia bacterium]|nr:hypothetical protein [Thermoanaerobaculia bacterium]
MRVIAVLGPQRLQPTVATVADSLEIARPIALVTAGWQERESEDEELRQHLGEGSPNLELYRRAIELAEDDEELAAAYRERQSRLRYLQELYRVRLGHLLDAARELLARRDEAEALERERDEAIATVRDLDRRHLERVDAVHAEFEERYRPSERTRVARHRREIAELLAPCSALAVAGGHVAGLLNRMRLFGVLELLGPKPILAWSAGAMALASRIVLFHDHPPQGAGNTEVLDSGLGAFPGLLPFPNARRRLRLRDPRRVSLLARRFAPFDCAVLDEGDQLFWNGGLWSSPQPIRLLTPKGSVTSHTGRLEPASDDAG